MRGGGCGPPSSTCDPGCKQGTGGRAWQAHRLQHARAFFPHRPNPSLQNVPPEKLFPRERAVRQLLQIIDRTSMQDTGRFYDWKGTEVEW